MKIVNRKKFLRSIVFLVGILTFVLLTIINSETLSHTEIKEKIIYVADGDTLWEIAEEENKTNEYYKDKDIREIIEEIKTKNQLNNANIYEGQKIIVAAY